MLPRACFNQRHNCHMNPLLPNVAFIIRKRRKKIHIYRCPIPISTHHNNFHIFHISFSKMMLLTLLILFHFIHFLLFKLMFRIQSMFFFVVIVERCSLMAPTDNQKMIKCLHAAKQIISVRKTVHNIILNKTNRISKESTFCIMIVYVLLVKYKFD